MPDVLLLCDLAPAYSTFLKVALDFLRLATKALAA